jgi:hypothetical protein
LNKPFVDTNFVGWYKYLKIFGLQWGWGVGKYNVARRKNGPGMGGQDLEFEQEFRRFSVHVIIGLTP